MEKVKIHDIKEKLLKCTLEEFLIVKEELSSDPRKSVHSLLKKEEKRFEEEAKQIAAYNNRKVYEMKLLMDNYKYIAGIDEVGRGPLAGPVYAAAVILDPSVDILGIKDSKKLSEKQRESLASEIEEKCISYSLGIATEEEIDRYNILNATKLAMKRAVEGLEVTPEYLLIDALKLEEVAIPQIPIIKGDDLSISIGAASIIAKVKRDRFMYEASLTFPNYQFDKNKGYGTGDHITAIKKFGPCKMHRKSFIKNFI